jgi:hypothetical protein
VLGDERVYIGISVAGNQTGASAAENVLTKDCMQTYMKIVNLKKKCQKKICFSFYRFL